MQQKIHSGISVIHVLKVYRLGEMQFGFGFEDGKNSFRIQRKKKLFSPTLFLLWFPPGCV